MSNPTKLRTILYNLILGFAFAQAIISAYCTVFPGLSDLGFVFGYISLGISACTWALTSVLSAYHNQPSKTNIFTMKVLHLVSFVVFTILWLVIGVVLLTQAPNECKYERYLKSVTGRGGHVCGFIASTGTGGLVLAILSATTAVFVHKSQASDEGNIAGTQQKPDEER
ncbi:hypothetical protein CVT24_006558 [Panaeolus cyanescens]|uniref:MARVEL domain-containing protein n=1 Tax=Panaeolus cyanescens TaxID=181874 RepID=A0A409WBY5_9AGAR|nr:hypothetical protein CVT24_006558 [Panaeolus cyanescens]